MTHHTDAEQLHQLLELVLTELDRKAIPIAYMQEIDRKGKAFIEQAARRAPAAPVPQQDVEKLRAELAEEVEAADDWRRLALQFDGHRMQAIGHLKAMLTDPQGSEANALAFIKAPPLHGDAVLAQRIAAIAAAPQPPEAAPVRKPLTDAEINALADAHMGLDSSYAALQKFAHAIERAHGIKE